MPFKEQKNNQGLSSFKGEMDKSAFKKNGLFTRNKFFDYKLFYFIFLVYKMKWKQLMRHWGHFNWYLKRVLSDGPHLKDDLTDPTAAWAKQGLFNSS